MILAEVNLPLRSIHATDSVPWWPLAPGWWGVIIAVLLCALLVAWWRRKEEARVARVRAFFDDDVAQGATEAERIGRMSELLRRAARTKHKDVEQLQGAEWLGVLNKGMKGQPFNGVMGELLLDGGFRRNVDPMQADALQNIARDRFVKWVRDV